MSWTKNTDWSIVAKTLKSNTIVKLKGLISSYEEMIEDNDYENDFDRECDKNFLTLLKKEYKRKY